MELYYAPMEGITGYLHRNVSRAVFPDIDKYMTPFIAANQKGKLSTKEKNDILPDHNEGMYVIPQILTNQADCFLAVERTLREYGYTELNLNLGCPSKTVVTKCRGSGFLAKPEELDHFLEEVFARTECEISLKTRIGVEDGEEFERLLEIYNKYPLKELIVHPRTQKDYYRNHPNMEWYTYAVEHGKAPLCYNGDITDVTSYKTFMKTYPDTDKVMIGRGLLVNPGLAGMLKGKAAPSKEQIREYHDRMYEAYREHMPGDRVVLFKMKELWYYLAQHFTDSAKYAKKIRKAERLPVYESAVNALFAEQDFVS